MPEISVLMGVYQPSPKLEPLRRAVQSILEQTVSSLELLICDDGSCAQVRALLEEFAARDNRVRLIRDPAALTLPQKLNLCLRFARGAYIARQDDDDSSFPDRFARQRDFLEARPEFGFVGCNVLLELEDGSQAKRTFPGAPRAEDFAFSMPFVHPALMFRRSALDAVGGYSEDPRCILCEDYDLLLRMYAAGLPGANLTERLFLYHVADRRRKMKYRVNETVTRWRRFSQLHMLPRYLPYVVKPVLTGLLPQGLLNRLKFKTRIYRK